MIQKQVITYPIPPYQNVPIHSHYYKPRRFKISAIGIGATTLVTTSKEHDYIIGQLVRLIIPNKFGSRQLNEVEGYVISIPAENQVVLDINSIGTDPFISNPTFIKFESNTVAQILGIGDINDGAINRHGRCHTKTYIPGSFRNISPCEEDHDR